MTAISLPTPQRPLALVTGASAGIGEAFARAFARAGYDVALVARRLERLEALAHALEAGFGVAAHPVAADLSRPEAPDEIFGALRSKGLKVAALVNNAGYGVPGLLDESPWPIHRDTLEVMVTAPVHLALLAAADMKARGGGHIINVGSVSGLLPPHAGGTLYYPVKAFLIKFSLAHGAELRRHCIGVTALCPGFTRTEFQQAAGGTVEAVTMPDFIWMDPDDVARAGLQAAMRGDPVCIPGWINRMIVRFFKYLPDPAGRWVIRLTSGEK